MALTLQHWLKTQEGEETLASGELFCYEGRLWQGPYSIHENDLETHEMSKVKDVDGTLERVWIQRRQRMESNFSQKEEEYSSRRVELITRRNEIMTAIEREKNLIGRASPAMLREIEKIDARMERISQAEAIDEIALNQQKKQELPADIADLPQERVDATCVCGKTSPPTHRNPKGWLSGHHMKCAMFKARREQEAVA